MCIFASYSTAIHASSYYSLVQWTTGTNQKKGYVQTHTIGNSSIGLRLVETSPVYSCTGPGHSTLPAGTAIEIITRNAFVYVSAPARFAVGDKPHEADSDSGDGAEVTADTSAEDDDAKTAEDNDGFLSAELVRDLGDAGKSKGKKIVLILRREYEMLRKIPTTANTDKVWMDNPNQTTCPSRVHGHDWVYADMRKVTISEEGFPFVWVRNNSTSTPPEPVIEGYIRASSLKFNTQKSNTGLCVIDCVVNALGLLIATWCICICVNV